MKKYPEDFRNLAKIAPVANQEINNIIEEQINKMKENELPQSIAFLGGVMVLIMKLHSSDGGGFDIIVTEDYSQTYYENEIFR